MIRTFTFYNHKGGVSKTTTTFNLAVYLALRMKRKVLLVDADPQSNLTESFFVPPLDEDAQPLPGTSIYEALKPRFEGAAARIDGSSIKLPAHEHYKNLYILRGDWNFSLAERYFSNALALAITESVHEKHTYVAFYNLIQDLIALHQFDHVLIDLGPASGAITNLALLSCDGYFIPVTPDRFCTQGSSRPGLNAMIARLVPSNHLELLPFPESLSSWVPSVTTSRRTRAEPRSHMSIGRLRS
jgi:chromosome partitioning protein